MSFSIGDTVAVVTARAGEFIVGAVGVVKEVREEESCPYGINFGQEEAWRWKKFNPENRLWFKENDLEDRGGQKIKKPIRPTPPQDKEQKRIAHS